MNTTEIIERLCAVVSELSAIVKAQGTFIEEQAAVDEAVKADFAARRSSIDAELNEICERAAVTISQ